MPTPPASTLSVRPLPVSTPGFHYVAVGGPNSPAFVVPVPRDGTTTTGGPRYHHITHMGQALLGSLRVTRGVSPAALGLDHLVVTVPTTEHRYLLRADDAIDRWIP